MVTVAGAFRESMQAWIRRPLPVASFEAVLDHPPYPLETPPGENALQGWVLAENVESRSLKVSVYWPP
jgi:hypothetical protein